MAQRVFLSLSISHSILKLLISAFKPLNTESVEPLIRGYYKTVYVEGHIK